MVKASTMQTPMVREVAFSLFLPSLDPFMREINILRSSQKKAWVTFSHLLPRLSVSNPLYSTRDVKNGLLQNMWWDRVACKLPISLPIQLSFYFFSFKREVAMLVLSRDEPGDAYLCGFQAVDPSQGTSVKWKHQGKAEDVTLLSATSHVVLGIFWFYGLCSEIFHFCWCGGVLNRVLGFFTEAKNMKIRQWKGFAIDLLTKCSHPFCTHLQKIWWPLTCWNKWRRDSPT